MGTRRQSQGTAAPRRAIRPALRRDWPEDGGRNRMRMFRRMFFGAAATLLTGALAFPAAAQKSGGVLRIYHRDSPASMSVHEEGTIGVIMPMMGVFNNLVMFDQHVPQ